MKHPLHLYIVEIECYSRNNKVGLLYKEDKDNYYIRSIRWADREVLTDGKYRALPPHLIRPDRLGYIHMIPKRDVVYMYAYTMGPVLLSNFAGDDIKFLKQYGAKND